MAQSHSNPQSSSVEKVGADRRRRGDETKCGGVRRQQPAATGVLELEDLGGLRWRTRNYTAVRIRTKEERAGVEGPRRKRFVNRNRV